MSSSPTSIYSSPKSNSSGHLSCGPLPIQYLNEDFEPYVRRRKRGENVKGQKNKIAELDETEQVIVRTCINSRERKRMHDLNDAFEKLRKILAYDKHASSRKASKINTLLLAGNCITKLSESNEELKAKVMELEIKLGGKKGTNHHNIITTTHNDVPLPDQPTTENKESPGSRGNASSPTLIPKQPTNLFAHQQALQKLNQMPINFFPAFPHLPPNPMAIPFLMSQISFKMNQHHHQSLPPNFHLFDQGALIHK